MPLTAEADSMSIVDGSPGCSLVTRTSVHSLGLSAKSMVIVMGFLVAFCVV
jgi:hypothetical protein